MVACTWSGASTYVACITILAMTVIIIFVYVINVTVIVGTVMSIAITTLFLSSGLLTCAAAQAPSCG